MVEREIIYSKDASADIKGIHDYLARGSLQYAKSFIKDLYNAIDELRDLPQKYTVLAQNKRYRKLVFRNYRVIYRYDEKEERIIVFMVSHGSMLIDMNRF